MKPQEQKQHAPSQPRNAADPRQDNANRPSDRRDLNRDRQESPDQGNLPRRDRSDVERVPERDVEGDVRSNEDMESGVSTGDRANPAQDAKLGEDAADRDSSATRTGGPARHESPALPQGEKHEKRTTM